MADKVIFLSHIHEEKALATLVKRALEDEFSGFVDVFVSSDGTSIPAGSNFLKRIEDGLVNCIGAIYLISPISVKRNWINFELGAVWVRNVMNLRAGNADIPTLPICHSGITPGSLPAPLNNLNAITANQASQLEFAFQSLQMAVGGKGKLRTDFDALVTSVIGFERQYTLGSNIKRMADLLGWDKRLLVQHCEQQTAGVVTTVDCGFVETNVVNAVKGFEASELKDHIKATVDMPGTSFGPNGAVNGAQLKIGIAVALVVQFKEQLLA